MDLQLTRRGEYAVRAALCLARESATGHYVKLREISAEMSIPFRYTQEILALLTRAGLAEARAGKQGGYRLLRAPTAISMLDLVEAAEGPLRMQRCTLSGGPCHWEGSVCAVHETWAESNQALTAALGRHTLQEAVGADEALRGAATGEVRAD